MPGGCVPIIAQKSKDRFKATDKNEKVPTVYNTNIMEAAAVEEQLCCLVPNSTTSSIYYD